MYVYPLAECIYSMLTETYAVQFLLMYAWKVHLIHLRRGRVQQSKILAFECFNIELTDSFYYVYRTVIAYSHPMQQA